MVSASSMTSKTRVPLKSRLLALLLGVFFALQPVVRANGSCDLRSMLAGRARGACCCKMDSARAAEGAAALPCCALRDAPAPLGGPVLGRASCGCELNAPTPRDALPGSVDPRSPNTDGAASAAHWIAEGARASAAMLWFPVAHPPDDFPDPSPGIGFHASRDGRLSAPDAVARSSARGVNGLLAVLGVALL
jgi:hypothetical protein